MNELEAAAINKYIKGKGGLFGGSTGGAKGGGGGAKAKAKAKAKTSSTMTKSELKIEATKVEESLPPEQLDAVLHYTGEGYSDMNAFSRAGEEPSASRAKKRIANLDKAIEQNGIELDRDVVVFRGIKETADTGLGKVKPGTVIEDRGFVSTSTSRGAAKDFLSHTATDPGILVKIKLKKGMKVLPVNDVLSSSPGEQELLLGRRTRFRVGRVTGKGKNRVLELEAL